MLAGIAPARDAAQLHSSKDPKIASVSARIKAIWSQEGVNGPVAGPSH